MKKNNIMTTDYVAGKRIYALPDAVNNPIKRLEVYNKKKNTWEIKDFDIAIYLSRKKRKTDTIIKAEYEENENK